MGLNRQEAVDLIIQAWGCIAHDRCASDAERQDNLEQMESVLIALGCSEELEAARTRARMLRQELL